MERDAADREKINWKWSPFSSDCSLGKLSGGTWRVIGSFNYDERFAIQ